MSAELRQPGWYIAQRIATGADPAVVRVSTDAEGGCTTVWEIGRRDPSTLLDWRLLHKVHSSGSLSDPEYHEKLAEAREEGRKAGQAEEHRKQVEYEAKRDHECPTFIVDVDDADFREVGEAVLGIRMPAAHAEAVSHGLSDFLCWARGFSAALGPDDSERRPMGIEWVRRIREAITKAQRAATKA